MGSVVSGVIIVVAAWVRLCQMYICMGSVVSGTLHVNLFVAVVYKQVGRHHAPPTQRVKNNSLLPTREML